MGQQFPLWHRNRHTHSDTQIEYLVCNRIHRNLKAQTHSHGAYCHQLATRSQTPEKNNNRGPTLMLLKPHMWMSDKCERASQTRLKRVNSGCVFQEEKSWRHLRWDWETSLVRLRPRESLWLDILLGVDKGCLVRTRPALQQWKREGWIRTNEKHTEY